MLRVEYIKLFKMVPNLRIAKYKKQERKDTDGAFLGLCVILSEYDRQWKKLGLEKRVKSRCYEVKEWTCLKDKK